MVYYPKESLAIQEVLACAYIYDDKPHLLFSCIRRLAEQYTENNKFRDEIIRLMDYAYENRGNPAPIKE